MALPRWLPDFIGLPYQPGGRTRDGIDCWGLVTLVWSEVMGHDLPPYEGQPWGLGASAAEVEASARRFANAFTQIPPGSERLGDGILLQIGGAAIHIGLVVEPGKMLHIADGANSCIEGYRSSIWGRRVAGFYRYG
jgi:cell wall-associated NlpC family hydrolase